MNTCDISELPEIREFFRKEFKDTTMSYIADCGCDFEKWEAAKKEGRLEKDYLLNFVKERCKNERFNID